MELGELPQESHVEGQAQEEGEAEEVVVLEGEQS